MLGKCAQKFDKSVRVSTTMLLDTKMGKQLLCGWVCCEKFDSASCVTALCSCKCDEMLIDGIKITEIEKFFQKQRLYKILYGKLDPCLNPFHSNCATLASKEFTSTLVDSAERDLDIGKFTMVFIIEIAI